MRTLLLAAVLLTAGCVPNPRNEIPAVVAAAMADVTMQAGVGLPCVERQIAPWQPAKAAGRIDPPPPAGFAVLLAPGVFRGGGGIKGARLAGVRVGTGAGCLDLRGPLIAGDLAMVEVHTPGGGWNVWLRREDARWRSVAVTRSDYPL